VFRCRFTPAGEQAVRLIEDEMEIESDMDFVVFYSWQSDLPDESNRRLIREALRNASSVLEEKYAKQNLRIILDEATRNKPGSPNIPITIMEKIEISDVFLCDISTINSDAPEEFRRVPNPNVLIELGYAIAHLGWKRIIMLFNVAFGNFPNDTPFDIDRHRASPYEFGINLENQKKKMSKNEIQNLKRPLVSLLYEAIEAILVHSPAKPKELLVLSPEEKIKAHDIGVIKELLSAVHIPTLDSHLVEAPYKVYDHIFHFWEGFNGIVTSKLFYLYDQKLREKIETMHSSWGKSLSYGHRYHSSPGGSASFFSKPMDMPFNDEEQKDWDTISSELITLNTVFQEILNHIREHYLEIEVEELSKAAWKEYVTFMCDFEAKIEKPKAE